MVLLSVVACGRNAFVESKNISSVVGSRTESVTPDKDSVVAKEVVVGKNINVGTIQIPVQVDLPLYLTNLSKSIQTISLASDNPEIKVLKQEISDLPLDTSIQNKVLQISPSEVGPFLYKVAISYTVDGKERRTSIEVSGVATEVSISHNANLELYRQDITVVKHGSIPVGSTSNVETVLKNTGLNTSIVTSIELLDKENFALLDNSDSCLSLVFENCVLKTSYNPKNEGKHSTHVKITYTDGKGISNVTLVPVSGEGNTEAACIETNEVAQFGLTQDQLTEEQLEGTVLPYKIQTDTTDTILEALYGDAYNKQDSNLESQYNYVEDAQVISLVDLKDVQTSGSIVDIKLYSKLLKSYLSYEGAKFLKTEILCLENILSCSGNKFFTGSYAEHNQDVYSVDSEYFSKEILKDSQRLKLDDGGLYIFEKTLDLAEAFPTKKEELFSSVRETSKLKTIFADDIKLDAAPLLKVKYKDIKDKLNKCNE
jgi:hypothetical protein